MKRYLLGFSLLTTLFIHNNTVEAQEAATIPVVIDTDCATDDFRAIAAFLSNSDFKVIGIVATDGGLSPTEGAAGLRKLVAQFGLNIPVVEGVGLGLNPSWRAKCRAIWKTEGTERSLTANYSDSLSRWFKDDQEQITYVCLGPVSSLNGWLQKVDTPHNLRRVVWFYGESEASANVVADTAAWNQLKMLPINIHLVGQPEANYAVSTESLIEKVVATGKPLAIELQQRMKYGLLKSVLAKSHFKMWDEMVPVYLAYPSLFEVKPNEKNPRIASVKIVDTSMVSDSYIKLFSGQGSALRGIVLESFPVSEELLSPDLVPFAKSIQQKHGIEEWKLTVLTNEMHQHLGIYSIVGTKMGLFAREYFGVGLDKVKVISLAGFSPPVSCLNDGLQIATGATLGRGTITVDQTAVPVASAKFEYKGKVLLVTLKSSYSKMAAKDISDGIVKYGNLTNGYWNLVRQLSIKYWLEWDRNEMFDYKEL